jgi:hypothetical protein
MTKSEIRYQIFLRVAYQDRTFEHCEQSRRTPGVLTAWCSVCQLVETELLPVGQAVYATIHRELEQLT